MKRVIRELSHTNNKSIYMYICTLPLMYMGVSKGRKYVAIARYYFFLWRNWTVKYVKQTNGCLLFTYVCMYMYLLPLLVQGVPYGGLITKVENYKKISLVEKYVWIVNELFE